MKKLLSVFSLVAILLGVNIAHAESDDFEIHHQDHLKFYKSKKDTASLDVNNDGLIDFYAKGYFDSTANKVFRIDYKIQDCFPHGSTFADAKMKVGFTNQIPNPLYTWVTNGFKAWNKLFKSSQNSDQDKQIDLISEGTTPSPGIPFPNSGDNVIQKSIHANTDSFKHSNSIKQLGGQAGWEGSISFTAPVGRYQIWSVFPAEGDITMPCDEIAGLGIPITVDSQQHEKESK